MISIEDLRARVQAVEDAPLHKLKSAARLALSDLLSYLEALQVEVNQLKGGQSGNRTD